MKTLVLLRNFATKYLVSPLILVTLLALLVYAIVNLIYGFSFHCLTELANTVPHPDRLRSSDAIEAVIAALGVVGSALSYINSAQTFRVKGILLEQVISWYWPHYGIIFLAHGVLSLLGLYSCQVNALHAAWACLIGILLCTCYSLYMAYKICFSRKGREQLIAQYLDELVKKKRFSLADDEKDNKSRPAEKNCLKINFIININKWKSQLGQKQKKFFPTEGRRTAYQLGLYIGEHYQQDDFQLDQFTDDSKINQQLLQSALALLEPEVKWAAQTSKGSNTYLTQTKDLKFSSKQLHEPWDGSLLDVFDYKIFPNWQPEHLKYTILLPITNERRCFQSHIRHCATLWDNLLHPIKQDGRKAKLVVDVLINTSDTAALCCGLVLYLYTSCTHSTSEKETWQSCANFLRAMANIARASNNLLLHDNRDKVLFCCMDMILLLICLDCLQIVNSVKTNTAPSAILIDLFASERWKNANLSCYISINIPTLIKYLYFSHNIFLLLAIPSTIIPSRQELFRQIPAITAIIVKFLDKDIFNIKTGGMDYGNDVFPSI